MIDELSPMERDNIDSYLNRTLQKGPMIGLYWLELPADLLSPIQHEHASCGPFNIGIEVEKSSVRFELLVRSTSNLHCKCTHYATQQAAPVYSRFYRYYAGRRTHHSIDARFDKISIKGLRESL